MVADGAVIGLLAAVLTQNTLLWIKVGKVEQELTDLKKYVLHINGDGNGKEKGV